MMSFRQHKNTATNRGISFKFTYEQWCAWWEDNLGANWIEKRGRNKGQFVMARNGDRGPYAVWNVRCKTAATNSAEANRNRRSNGVRLTNEDVKTIFLSPKTNKELIEIYNVGKNTIERIKARQSWLEITNKLIAPSRKNWQRGSSHHSALLNDEKVKQIRKSKKSRRELAEFYGVHYQTICNILSKRQWRHLL